MRGAWRRGKANRAKERGGSAAVSFCQVRLLPSPTSFSPLTHSSTATSLPSRISAAIARGPGPAFAPSPLPSKARSDGPWRSTRSRCYPSPSSPTLCRSNFVVLEMFSTALGHQGQAAICARESVQAGVVLRSVACFIVSVLGESEGVERTTSALKKRRASSEVIRRGREPARHAVC